MELLFIGTSSGRTSLNRFHSSILFKSKLKNVLIDTGDGVAKALMNQNIEFNSIKDIILSHFHSDHLAGLPSLLTQMIINKRTEPLNIFTHSTLLESLHSFLEITYLFLDKIEFELNLIGFELDERVLITDSFYLTAKQNSHIRNKYNINSEKVKFISMSFLVEYSEKKIIYTSDISSTEDLFLFGDINSDIFITEAAHLPFKKLEEILINNSSERIYLTHIDNEKEVYKWYDELSSKHKEKFIIAAEGLTITL